MLNHVDYLALHSVTPCVRKRTVSVKTIEQLLMVRTFTLNRIAKKINKSSVSLNDHENSAFSVKIILIDLGAAEICYAIGQYLVYIHTFIM